MSYIILRLVVAANDVVAGQKLIFEIGMVQIDTRINDSDYDVFRAAVKLPALNGFDQRQIPLISAE
ncbi:hypothetical protein D3C84_1282010 [compost metagenome]